MRDCERAPLTVAGLLRHPASAGLASGVLLGTAYLCVPYLGPLLAWVALLPLLRLWRDELRLGARVWASALGMGLAQVLALGYFLPFAPAPMSVVLAVQAVAASLPWLALAGLCRLTRLEPARALWLLPGLWLTNEWALSFVPDIVPTPLGGALGGLPEAIWFYGITGVWGGTLLLVSFQVGWITSRSARRRRYALAAGFVLLLHGLGALLPRLAPTQAPGAEIALVRTGALHPGDDIVPWLDRALILSAQAARAGAELIVWPESMIPWNVADNPAHPLHQALIAQPARHDVPFLLGINQALDPFTLHNGAAMLRPGESLAAAQIQHKRWLLPLKESRYLFGLGTGWVRPGETHRALSFIGRNGQPYTLGPLICYEVLVSAAAVDQVRAGTQALVVLANDAEFHQTPARWQLDAQARVRAVETRRDVLRVASVGALQHFDAWGKQIVEQKGEAGFVRVTPRWRDGASFYVRQPHWLPLLALCAVAAGILATLLYRSRAVPGGRCCRVKTASALICSVEI